MSNAKIIYDRKIEKAIEEEWKKYNNYAYPVRYFGKEKNNEYYELCRKIFLTAFREGNVSKSYLKKNLNADYECEGNPFVYTTVDGEDTNFDSVDLFTRWFTFEWDGFTIIVNSENGTISKNLFHRWLGRKIHVSDYWAKIYYKGQPIKGFYNKTEVLKKFSEWLTKRILDAEEELKKKLEEIVSSPGSTDC